MPRSRGRTPLYQRIADDLREQITSGALAPGAKVPTEAVLEEQYKTTRATVRQGIGVLVNEGLVVSDRPRGHFVRAWSPMLYQPQAERFRKRPDDSPSMDQFVEDQARVGRDASQIIEVAIVAPPPEVAERLALPEGAAAVVRRRIRRLDGQPFNINDSYFPQSIVEGTEIASPHDIARGANTVLAELGYEQVRATDEIFIRMPRPIETERLDLGPGTPVAIHVCTGYTAAGQPVRVVVNCLPGDRHVIKFERTADTEGTA